MKFRAIIAVSIRVFSESIKRIMSQPTLPANASQCCASSFQESAPPTYAMYETLKDLCQNNADYFKPDDSENGQRLYAGFVGLMDHIDTVWPLVDHVRKLAPLYDLDEATPGNGYRSFVSVVDSCILHGVRLGRQVTIARETFMFRKSYYTREVEACGQLLASLGTCLHHLHTLLGWAPEGELFPSGHHSPEELFAQADTINQYCFYGRCLGFQFHPSMRGILKGISICMAGFSEAYYSKGNIINSVWTGGQYVIDPELRARRIVNISQNASVEFCKAFWFLAESEIMQRVPNLVSVATAVNKIISIPPEEITLTKLDNSEVIIPPPDAHIGTLSLNVRLISTHKRQGMVGEASCSLPPSDGIIVHCHGGGFVAQSSKSHEVYLREWASLLNVPIVSIDYSLAPKAPFPRALQEVFYVYCWVLKNAHLLGTTAKRIVLVGDSAGANLNTGSCLKALQMGIRPPDGLFLAYATLLISFVPSPARILCLMDPLLPFGFMMRCLKAYSCPPLQNNDTKKDIKNKTDDIKPTSAGNGVLKTSSFQDMGLKAPLSPIPGAAPGVSSPSSFEDISASDLTELQAHKSGSEISDGQATLSCESLSSEHKTAVTPQFEDQSEKFVNDFLERYVLESDTDSEGRKVPVLRRRSLEDRMTPNSSVAEISIGDCSTPDCDNLDSKLKSKKGLHSRIAEAAGNIVGAVTNTFSSLTVSNKITKADSNNAIRTSLDSLIARSPSDEFIFSVPRDPYLSPYWADDELLKKFPPTKILSVHLDPCLDDCVMFAKKLKKLGVPIGLDVLEGLPHGFLNFALMCREANDGSKLCVQRIKELLSLDEYKSDGVKSDELPIK